MKGTSIHPTNHAGRCVQSGCPDFGTIHSEHPTHCPAHPMVALLEIAGWTVCRICIEPSCDVCEEPWPVCTCEQEEVA